jgi:hypothetical protein
MPSILALFLALILACSMAFAGTPAGLKSSFARPPESARPWVYWVWMDGNLTHEGLTADLVAMKRAGIGGVIIMEVNVGIPRGQVEFMSPEWRECFKHVVTEAERLGIEITLISGPGWTGSGGPWVRPEQSMQHIVGSTTAVTGPRKFDDTLARPARRPAFFGDGLLPAPLEKQKDEYYRDVAVLAYPTPTNPQTIPGIDEKALYVRAPYSSVTSVPPFIPSYADYPATPAGAAIDPARVVNLSDRWTTDGRFSWDVPPGNWTILRLGATSTGANTRPAPKPGLGLECDKLDTAALNAHFDAFFGTLLRDIGPRDRSVAGGWKNLHIDSWEMGAQNWTGKFRMEFERRRGYDLLKYLPTVTGAIVGSRELTERFLWDLRQTVNELILENHAGHLKELGRRHGFGISIEPYDMTPCADMSLGSIADVPMCEFWMYGFNTSYSVLQATSIAHTIGSPIVGAEAFTSLDTEHWDAFPGSMKVLGDWAFAAGVNRFVFHRYQHQPWNNLRPGMTMGPFGVHWERTQTWWELSGDYHQYLSRCQWMLRQGLPVADVLYLVPEGAPQVFRPPSSAVRGNPPDKRGYNFDGCAPDVFLARAAFKEGLITFPDGVQYRILVLPERETMTAPLLRRVQQLVSAGATVIGPPPQKSPGLSGYPRRDSEIATLAENLWGDCDGVSITEHAYGNGRVIWVKGPQGNMGDTLARFMRVDASSTAMLAGVARKRNADDGPGASEPEQYGDFSIVEKCLQGMGAKPDFESDAAVRYAHRRDGQSEIYFVANPQDRTVNAACTFRVAGKQPELWDPITGTTRDLPEFLVADGRTSVKLQFQPRQSMFVVFSQPARKRAARNFPSVADAFTLEGSWDVTFDTAWGGPGPLRFEDLRDWTEREETKHFSGVATYAKTFDLPKSVATRISGKNATGVWLSLGVVNDMALVRLNGKDLGVLWTAPWRVDIRSALKPSGNRLEILVANRWRNRLVGDEALPNDAEFGTKGGILRWPEWLVTDQPRPATGRFSFSSWRHFSADTPLLPSGLTGPVKILLSGQ